MLGDFWQGLGYALSGLLQSPNFLYRVEVGTPGAVPGPARVRRLGAGHPAVVFPLASTTPDDALLDAAQAAPLTRPGGLRREAERLLDSPRGQDGGPRLLLRAAAPRRAWTSSSRARPTSR